MWSLTFDAFAFELGVFDDEPRLFSIVGPMSNDLELATQVLQYCETGRRMRYDGPLEAGKSRSALIAECRARTGHYHSGNVFDAAIEADTFTNDVLA